MKDIPFDSVLALDDQPEVLKLAERVIEFSGFNPVVSTDLSEALEIYRQNAAKFPVVLTDRSLGREDINGDDFAESVRAIANSQVPPLNVRIIMLSGDNLSIEQQAKIKSKGVDLIMSKPYRPTVLKNEILKGKEQFNGVK